MLLLTANKPCRWTWGRGDGFGGESERPDKRVNPAALDRHSLRAPIVVRVKGPRSRNSVGSHLGERRAVGSWKEPEQDDGREPSIGSRKGGQKPARWRRGLMLDRR